MIKIRNLNARKLLTATAGLATVSYLGTTSCSSYSSGNLVGPYPYGSGGDQTTNAEGSGGDEAADGSGGYYYTSGNLMAPSGGNEGVCDFSDQTGNGGDGGDGGEGGDRGVGCAVR